MYDGGDFTMMVVGGPNERNGESNLQTFLMTRYVETSEYRKLYADVLLVNNVNSRLSSQ